MKRMMRDSKQTISKEALVTKKERKETKYNKA